MNLAAMLQVHILCKVLRFDSVNNLVSDIWTLEEELRRLASAARKTRNWMDNKTLLNDMFLLHILTRRDKFRRARLF